MSGLVELLVSLFLVLGAIIMLIGSIGLAKFPDFFTRLHAPTKASTLGVGCILIASMIYFSFDLGHLTLKELLISVFLLITAPIAAHMLAKAGLHYKVKLKANTQNPHLSQRAYLHQKPKDDE